MMLYISSQSYHTLNHWQSGRKTAALPSDDTFTGWLKDDNFQIGGILDDDKIALFPYTMHEDDATAGEEQRNTNAASQDYYVDTAYYKSYSPSDSDLIYEGQWKSSDDYYCGMRVYKIGTARMVPGAVPWTYSGSVEASFNILKRDAAAKALTIDGTKTLTLSKGYTGPVIIATVSRYYLEFDFEDSPLSGYTMRGESGISLKQVNTTVKRWNQPTFGACAHICIGGSNLKEFREVPDLKNKAVVYCSNNYMTGFHWGTIKGGYKLNGTGFYKAGNGTAIPYDRGRVWVPVVTTGGNNAYVCETMPSVTVPVPTTVIRCDPYDQIEIDRFTYNGGRSYYDLPTEGKACYIFRRLHSIDIREGFSFFT